MPEYYDTNFDIVVKQGIPVRQRKPKRLAWLWVLASPVKWSMETVVRPFIAAKLFYLNHNSQVCYMEKALNDVFDPQERRINIVNGEMVIPVAIYMESEEVDVPIALESELPVEDYEAPLPVYMESETLVGGYQFIVRVPTGLVYDEVKMRWVVDMFRLPSKKVYTIIEF